MGDHVADGSRRRLLKGISATAALTWSAPKLSSFPAVARVGTPPPTTEPPTTTPTTTEPPVRPVTGTASGTSRMVPPIGTGNLNYQATGAFTLSVIGSGSYTVNSHWTPLDSAPPFHIAVAGPFTLEPSGGGTLYGYMRGTEVWDGMALFTATWNLEVQGGLGALRGVTGLLRWQGTCTGDLLQTTDEFNVDGSIRLP
jgi:hypothetical protein